MRTSSDMMTVHCSVLPCTRAFRRDVLYAELRYQNPQLLGEMR